MLPGIKAVLFDCDGVLCEPWRFANVLNDQHGITIEMTKHFFKNDFVLALEGKVFLPDILPNYLEQWGWSQSVQDFIDLWLDSEKEVSPKTIELVELCSERGLITALATNQESCRARYMREVMGFEQLFKFCFISSEVGHCKPQLGFYQSVMQQLAVQPNEILFIDDQLNYLIPAKELGWKTLLFTDAESVRAKMLSGAFD